jgi:predicted nucleic acid-binding protein
VNNILLDTNAYTAFAAGDTSVSDAIFNSDTVFMSVVALGELYAGFYGGTKPDWNINILDEFLAEPAFNIQLLDINHSTSKMYGKIHSLLKQNGKKIPLNDIWIAAHALESDSTLITFDHHFTFVSNLKIWTTLKR